MAIATANGMDVWIPAGSIRLPGVLHVPTDGCGLVLFAHGSGSSRLSPRNRLVASELHRMGLGTLLFDLLTESEGSDRQNVFNIELLAGRLLAASSWAASDPATAGAAIGVFGASTGAAAALVAAAQDPTVRAVVSRGGRPDLAGSWLSAVSAPTLLIVGGEDHEVVLLNRRAFTRLACEKELSVVAGATHLFEEPGTLGTVARLARDWFVQRLTRGGRPWPGDSSKIVMMQGAGWPSGFVASR